MISAACCICSACIIVTFALPDAHPSLVRQERRSHMGMTRQLWTPERYRLTCSVQHWSNKQTVNMTDKWLSVVNIWYFMRRCWCCEIPTVDGSLSTFIMYAEDWWVVNCSQNRKFPKNKITRKCGNYSDVLPLKAARRDSISNLTSFGASNLSCRWTQCRFI